MGLVVLVVIGPIKGASVARDLGWFANEVRRSVDEFKDDPVTEDGSGVTTWQMRVSGCRWCSCGVHRVTPQCLSVVAT